MRAAIRREAYRIRVQQVETHLIAFETLLGAVPSNSTTATFVFDALIGGVRPICFFVTSSAEGQVRNDYYMARKRRKSAVKKLGDKQILVVEDHPVVGEVLTALLTVFDHPSHAESGKEALKQIKQKRPDIILLDLKLPDMNGLEFAKRLRQNETTKSIRILAMSGSPLDRQAWLEAGCNDFILKPFSTSTLLDRLTKLAA